MTLGWVLAACTPDAAPERGPEPSVTPAPATLRRLTAVEYANTVRDLFGADVVLPVSLEPDTEVDGFLAVGAGSAALSPLGVEQYESASYLIAGQVTGDPAVRDALTPCEPVGTVDDACARAFLSAVGRGAWRRSLAPDEVEALVGIAHTASGTVGSFWGGLEYAVAALLQSPNFLYRVELGDAGAFTGVELATRMSYLLWAGPPDAELLDLAERGALADPEVRRDQAERMWSDPRARRGLRAYYDQHLRLAEVPGVVKDPALFVHWADGVGDAAREQTLETLEWSVFDADADHRDLLTTRTTFLDRSLAALYGVPAPARDGFAEAVLPRGGRAGLLGQASFLALAAHSTSTSVTRRGVFVRTRLLCHEIPPPPANVDTSIPAPSAEAPTMRDRVASHLENPACASCHEVTDPIGLAFETYDGIGRWRTTEAGAPIDPSGDLDGEPFADAASLVELLRDHPDFPACQVDRWLTYAQGHSLVEGEGALADWSTRGFVGSGHRVRFAWLDWIASDAFAVASEAP